MMVGKAGRGWISGSQLERDHNGLRNACCICGNEGTAKHPLVVDRKGDRTHARVYDERIGRDTCSIFV